MICASEQSVTVLESVYEEVKKEFAYRGCYFLKKDEIEKVRKTIIINGALNAKNRRTERIHDRKTCRRRCSGDYKDSDR